ERNHYHDRTVSPAYAGIDPRARGARGEGLRFPRIRGDRPAHVFSFSSFVRFPPHTRGSTVVCQPFYLLFWVSPAYAGIDLRSQIETRSACCFPRIRGDRPFSFSTQGLAF